ncbi:MAG TPA: SURF1 family protein [Arenimonas sp.]|uniref:SURF1 family protein n=1 Tax=Arenimonas sp. TaxID=1872635 RepID=UPI002BA65E31|nr:SURF1 family protein [Arenimonas sp.]HMB57578.1 SURF1 family protein [Arenimonas sp.]
MKSRIVLWLLALAVATGFVALGRWQLHRAVEKQTMLDRVAQVMTARQAQPLAALSRSNDLDYAWAAGHGVFPDAPALLLDNQRRGDAVGVHVYRVFLPDQGRALLVDLGWLPLAGDRALPTLVPPPADSQLRGLLLPPPAAGMALGPGYAETDAQRWLLTRIDLPLLSKALRRGLAPRVLRLDPALPLGYARDLDVLPNTLPPERHRGYALQWFAMAAAVLIIALLLTLRRPKP